jgi:hypothetical protein
MTGTKFSKGRRKGFFTVTIIQIGNGLGFRIPPKIVKEYGLKEGDRVTLTFELRKRSGFGMCRGAGPFVEEPDGHRDIG